MTRDFGIREQHPLAGKTVVLKLSPMPEYQNAPGILELQGLPYVVEDWWQNVSGKSWMQGNGNPACMKYAIRSADCGLPIDDEVLYGKVGPFGHLVHISELGEVIE